MRKEEKFFEDAINEMMKIAGHNVTYDDLPKGEIPDEEAENPWYTYYTMTQDQNDEFRKWFIQKSRKVFKVTKKKAQADHSWFSLSYGLKISSSPYDNI